MRDSKKKNAWLKLVVFYKYGGRAKYALRHKTLYYPCFVKGFGLYFFHSVEKNLHPQVCPLDKISLHQPIRPTRPRARPTTRAERKTPAKREASRAKPQPDATKQPRHRTTPEERTGARSDARHPRTRTDGRRGVRSGTGH